MNYHIGRLVLSKLCVGAFAAADIWWCSCCRVLQPATRTPPNISRSKNCNTQRTENKTTDVVIHQQSRRLLKMDILMSETCWAHNNWNKITSDIKLVFHSTIELIFGLFGGVRWLVCLTSILTRRLLHLYEDIIILLSHISTFVTKEMSVLETQVYSKHITMATSPRGFSWI